MEQIKVDIADLIQMVAQHKRYLPETQLTEEDKRKLESLHRYEKWIYSMEKEGKIDAYTAEKRIKRRAEILGIN